MRALLLAIAFCFVFAEQAQVEEPPNSGVYIKVSEQWTSLEPIRMAGGGTKHLAKMFVPGLTPQIVWVFRDPHAPIKVSGNSVKLFVRDVPAFDDRDVLIVKFDAKKDHRELQTTSGGNLLTFKSGFSKERAPDFDTHRISDHTFSIVPREPLHTGEYMITISPGTSGYDFTVQ